MQERASVLPGTYNIHLLYINQSCLRFHHQLFPGGGGAAHPDPRDAPFSGKVTPTSQNSCVSPYIQYAENTCDLSVSICHVQQTVSRVYLPAQGPADMNRD